MTTLIYEFKVITNVQALVANIESPTSPDSVLEVEMLLSLTVNYQVHFLQ